jgi:hypothetical protein
LRNTTMVAVLALSAAIAAVPSAHAQPGYVPGRLSTSWLATELVIDSPSPDCRFTDATVDAAAGRAILRLECLAPPEPSSDDVIDAGPEPSTDPPVAPARPVVGEEIATFPEITFDGEVRLLEVETDVPVVVRSRVVVPPEWPREPATETLLILCSSSADGRQVFYRSRRGVFAFGRFEEGLWTDRLISEPGILAGEAFDIELTCPPANGRVVVQLGEWRNQHKTVAALGWSIGPTRVFVADPAAAEVPQ